MQVLRYKKRINYKKRSEYIGKCEWTLIEYNSDSIQWGLNRRDKWWDVSEVKLKCSKFLVLSKKRTKILYFNNLTTGVIISRVKSLEFTTSKLIVEKS